MKKLTKAQKVKFISNLKWFAFPTLFVFFGQLASGVKWQKAFPVALLVFWGTMRDYFKKAK